MGCAGGAFNPFQGLQDQNLNCKPQKQWYPVLSFEPSLFFIQVFTFSQKISVNFQLLLRFIQGVAFLLAIAGIAVAVALSTLSITDIFACILAFVPTGWGILSVSYLNSSVYFFSFMCLLPFEWECITLLHQSRVALWMQSNFF